MFILRNISYTHPDKVLLFSSINLSVNNRDKIALIGNNGSGKSTLLKIIAGEIAPSGGQISIDTVPYYVPQLFGQYNHLTIAQALRVERKLSALSAIINGDTTTDAYTLLNDDWTIEERCEDALRYWQLADIDLSQKMETLSGGQQMKVFLAGISIHQPGLILLDEPTNHLDIAARQLLYQFIQSISATLVVVSHDRQLLNLFGTVCELSKHGITTYGGNYTFYATQKETERNALYNDLQSMEKALRKAKDKERETLERQQKLDARGKKKQEKAGVAKIMMNTLRNSAENSTSKIKDVHAQKIDGINKDLKDLRSALPDVDKIKFGLDKSALHKGKVLFTAFDINFSYDKQFLWKEHLSFQVASGERITLKGINGSGKTTLIKVILGTLKPQSGYIYKAECITTYIDQDYSLISNGLTIYQQAEKFNTSTLQEHEIKNRLNRFLFTKEDWDKSCSALSGGEKMRLILCCLTIHSQSPDMIVLDEPTNNLDMQNIEILAKALNEYEGTLIVVSHDAHFLEQVHIERTIQL